MALAKGSFEIRVPLADENNRPRGFRTCRGYKIPGVKPLVVVGHEGQDPAYSVTHTATGASLGLQHRHLAGARRLAKYFWAELTDEERQAFTDSSVSDLVGRPGVAARSIKLRDEEKEKWA